MHKIIWNCNHSIKQNEGYKTSSDEISSRLKSKGLNINYLFQQSNRVKEYLIPGINIQYEKEYYDNPCDILINNTLPNGYIKSTGYNIGFTYWETTKLPSEWVVKMNEMDEIWTTSEWAKDVFIDSGVTVPVYNFTLGIDDKIYNPKLRVRHNPFTFLSIGSPSTRKNTQMTVDAYIRMFGGNPNFRLIYKTIGPPDARVHPKTVHVKPLYQHDNIEIIDQDLSHEELGKLYDRINCVVYPTSGEGWGWFPFQSIAKGIPTICPAGTACSEYAELSVPLKFQWSSENLFGIYSGHGEWMKPDFDDLCDKMLDVSVNYEKYADMTYVNVVDKFKTMTWDYAIERYYARICQILKK